MDLRAGDKRPYNPITDAGGAAATVDQEEAMTEMEMLKELRKVVASIAGQAGGNREAVKAEIRAELVSTIKERFGAYLDRVKRWRPLPAPDATRWTG